VSTSRPRSVHVEWTLLAMASLLFLWAVYSGFLAGSPSPTAIPSAFVAASMGAGAASQLVRSPAAKWVLIGLAVASTVSLFLTL
jgi:hypothetical protein